MAQGAQRLVRVIRACDVEPRVVLILRPSLESLLGLLHLVGSRLYVGVRVLENFIAFACAWTHVLKLLLEDWSLAAMTKDETCRHLLVCISRDLKRRLLRRTNSRWQHWDVDIAVLDRGSLCLRARARSILVSIGRRLVFVFLWEALRGG